MSRPIKVLILDNSFTFGGAINSLCHLLRAMDKQGFAPILVTGQPQDYLLKNFTCSWYHYIPKLPWVNNHIYLRLRDLTLFRFTFFKLSLHLLSFLYWFLFITLPEAVLYYRLGHKHQVDIVHLNNILGSQLAGILTAKLLRVPCVAHLRDFEEIHPLTRFYARMIEHHVAISSAVYDNLLHLGVPKERITLIHDAIDLTEFSTEVDNTYLFDEFSLSSEQLRFGIFGRVVEWKGIQVFIHAVSIVAQEIPGAVAFIVGNSSDGDQSFIDQMMQLTEHLGLSDRIIFTGYRQDIPALMKFMDVIVHASNRPEPFGMVLIEGMAVSKPIIATRGGGPLDIVVEHETGFLVEMGDPEALGKALCELLRQPKLRKRMGQAGFERVVNQFSCIRYAKQMEVLFEKIVGDTF